MAAPTPTSSITAGELCKKLRRLEMQVKHARERICGLAPGSRIEYQMTSPLADMLDSLEKIPDNELVQPGVCIPPI